VTFYQSAWDANWQWKDSGGGWEADAMAQPGAGGSGGAAGGGAGGSGDGTGSANETGGGTTDSGSGTGSTGSGSGSGGGGNGDGASNGGSDGPKVPVAAIAGSVVGGVVGLVLLGVGVWGCRKRAASKKK
jgi:hypothetical protein